MDFLSEGEKNYIRNGIVQGKRIDGRGNLDPREYHLKLSPYKNTNGSCVIEIPDSSSKIICAVKLELDEPSLDKVKEGKIEVVLDCSHTKGSKTKAKYVLDKIQLILSDLIISRIPKEPLCIVEGKKCWKLFLNLFVLGYPSLAYIDAMSLAIKAVFSDLKIPKLNASLNQITGEWEIELDENLEEKEFPSKGIPILATLGKVGSEIVIDMSREEYYSVDNTSLVGVEDDGKVSGFYFSEGSEYLDIMTLPNLLSVAQKVVFFYHEIINQELGI